MTLVVEFDEFIRSVRRYAASDEPLVYYKPARELVHLTYVNPVSNVQVVSFFAGSADSAVAALEAAGVAAAKGTWVTEASLEHLSQIAGEAYISAVAYQTHDGPGLWMDASPVQPLESTVFLTMFNEFVAEGHLKEEDYELFIANAMPTVRVLTPDDVQRFIAPKRQPLL